MPAFISCSRRTYFTLNDLPKSEVSLREAIALDPKTPEAYGEYRLRQRFEGRGQSSEGQRRRAAPRLQLRGTLTEYEKESNWEEAKKFCEQAHEVDSTAPIVADLLFFILSMAAMSMSRLD